MREPMYHDDFEHYLQEQVKQHRVYPSDQIWRNIQVNLHGEKRWPALTFISIFIIAALTITTLFIKPAKKVTLPVNNEILSANNKLEDFNTREEKINANVQEHFSLVHVTQQTIDAVSEKLAMEDSSNLIATVTPSQELPAIAQPNPIIILDEHLVKIKSNHNQALALHASTDITDFIHLSAQRDELLQSFSSINLPKIQAAVHPSALVIDESLFSSTANNNQAWKNFAQSFVPNIIHHNKYSHLLDFQFYVTPSMSYRRLVDVKNKALTQEYSTIPASANYRIDVNQVVRHRPAIGTEVGFAFGYKLNDQLSIKTGLQFNIRQYYIDAYSYNFEQASVALLGSNRPDSFNSFTNVRNFPVGSSPITLTNRYYQVSIPVGIDWKVLSARRLEWHIGAAIQPTYTFDKAPFIITSDYKNYTDGSSLMRNWNFNTNFETYLSYKFGGIKWQFGPQFRYQQLPTLSNKYSIKEYLLDYGFKIGFSKTIR